MYEACKAHRVRRLCTSCSHRFAGNFSPSQSRWQMEELSRQEKDEGRTAGWHMRQLALAAQAWLRQGKAASLSTRGIKEMRAKLDQAHQALLSFAQRSPKELARVAGAAAFVKAAEDVVRRWHKANPSKRRGAALAACARLLAAFNVLVVD